jgi:uncharacterized protein YecT (DUF1311 family)
VRRIDSHVRLKLSMRVLLIVVAVLASPAAFAHDSPFAYKELADFKRLDEFADPAAFEAYIDTYVQDCLDHTYGGTAGIPCNIADVLWDRELNTYYARLLAALDQKSREQLKSAQREWLRSRDESLAFHRHLADLRYPKEGTMYLLLRAEDLHATAASITKERTLLIKRWLDLNHEEF